MSTLTPRLSLKKNDGSDPFLRTDFSSNYDKLDAAPGVHVCTSSSRPSWGSNEAGRTILETDTNLLWRWTGSAFARTYPLGRLASGFNTSTLASSSTTTMTNVVNLTNVVVPAGGRSIMFMAGWQILGGTNGWAYITVADGLSILKSWIIRSDAVGPGQAYEGCGGAVTWTDTVAPGVHSFQFQFRAYTAGTAHVTDGSLTVLEI